MTNLYCAINLDQKGNEMKNEITNGTQEIEIDWNEIDRIGKDTKNGRPVLALTTLCKDLFVPVQVKIEKAPMTIAAFEKAVKSTVPNIRYAK